MTHAPAAPVLGGAAPLVTPAPFSVQSVFWGIKLVDAAGKLGAAGAIGAR